MSHILCKYQKLYVSLTDVKQTLGAFEKEFKTKTVSLVLAYSKSKGYTLFTLHKGVAGWVASLLGEYAHDDEGANIAFTAELKENWLYSF